MVVSTRVRVLLVAMAVVGMALGIIAVLGAVSSASPNNTDDDDHRNDKGRTLTVVGKNPQSKGLDLGAQGPTQGDLVVINARIYDESAKERIGRFDMFVRNNRPSR